MQRISGLICFLFLTNFLMFTSCGNGEPDGRTVKVTRVVRNESGNNVRVKSYFNANYQFKIVEYDIPNGGQYEEEGQFYLGGVGEPGRTSEMEWIGTVDSVFITFGDLKFARHCVIPEANCVNIKRSIIFDYTFSGIKDGYVLDSDLDETYVYTISEEDYQNAESL